MSEQVSAGNVSPALSRLQLLTLGAPPAARPAHHPDHGGQGLLDLQISDCSVIIKFKDESVNFIFDKMKMKKSK